MNSISSFLSEPFIVLPMQATDREAAVRELLHPLEQQRIIDSSKECLESILKRERRLSTGIGKGVALPHGLSENIEGVAMVMGISPEGIDFKAPDGVLCRIFILLISPSRQPDKHHKLLSRITRLLSEGQLRSTLVRASTAGEVLETLRKWEAEGEEDVPI